MASSFKFNFSIENLVPVSNIIINTAQKNVSTIVKLYKKYDQARLDGITVKMEAIDKLISPSLLIGKISLLTQSLNDKQAELVDKFSILEGHVDRAKPLSLPVKSFGIKQIRDSIHSDNVEGTIAGLAVFINAVKDEKNEDALILEGMDKGELANIIAYRNSLLTLRSEQKQKMQEKESLVEDNRELINDFWTEIADLCDIGKRVFKKKDESIADNFTVTKVVASVDRKLKLNGASGLVANEAGEPLNGAKIELLPLEQGRRRTIKSKNGGKYSIDRVTAGKYLLNVTLKNHQKFTQEIEVVDGEFLALDVVLKKVE